MERLDKLLASTGRWSRREVKLLMKEGRVLVNGVPVRSGEEKVEPSAVRIQVDGGDLEIRTRTYILLHKPAGVLSATEDPRQETVLDLLTPELRRQGLFPVGRLDKDTEGLLLLTNDGDLAHRLLAPKSHVDKVYYARLDQNPSGFPGKPEGNNQCHFVKSNSIKLRFKNTVHFRKSERYSFLITICIELKFSHS